MSERVESTSCRNYYDGLLDRLTARGLSLDEAVTEVAEAYLDGRPAALDNRKTTRKDRDWQFWTSRAAAQCPASAWSSEALVMAVARYLGQEPITIDRLLDRMARADPAALMRAVRYSGLVLNQRSPRMTELRAAALGNEELTELCKVLDVFDGAPLQRVAALESFKARLAALTAFELLLYVSLYAFERLVPREPRAVSTSAANAELQTTWDAIGDLLVWKLRSDGEAGLALSEEAIGRAIAQHLRPILFEEQGSDGNRALQTLAAVRGLIAAQIELNEFIDRSGHAFSYDDSIRFERRGDALDIVELDAAQHEAWRRDGLKLEKLNGYWLYRAMDHFVLSEAAAVPMGRAENHDANRIAWVQALQAQLRLQEVYGVGDVVTTDSGERVPLFQSLLALSLMSAFYLRDFLWAFAERSSAAGDWLSGLRRLATDGMRDGFQNRLPLTWSDRDTKIRNLTGWTVTREWPQGSARVAGAVLDFWTYDLTAMARRLQDGSPGLEPHLIERPVLKFGGQLVQLPWLVGMQNNSSAAINNLRRLGVRRGQAREETERIESNLCTLFRQRGFAVQINWHPPHEDREAGEVDLIAARDGHLFVLEVKSTFLRWSHRDAWLHATTTLRRAGRQLTRKVEIVTKAVAVDPSLRDALGFHDLEKPAGCHAWIVDTSIERDHQRFSGFLKISVEELVIALRDDAHLLADPDGLQSGQALQEQMPEVGPTGRQSTLYPEGFSAGRLVEVIASEAVWGAMGRR